MTNAHNKHAHIQITPTSNTMGINTKHKGPAIHGNSERMLT